LSIFEFSFFGDFFDAPILIPCLLQLDKHPICLCLDDISEFTYLQWSDQKV
jgi:hypothetical protein